ncbi:hypothetical protein HNY73_019572 [Argiope bruennichi]|uniref:Uncharacterized protein n=1 Tax=Argiope bruennichi TaxID=94029 RepID=A0A8T0E5B3_ARGBR|nr:hypothetical protein HNY73_019572 [Argiope bruennichi]
MEVNKVKSRYILQFLFDKVENSIQEAKIVNGVYGPVTVTTNYVQFWFCPFHSDKTKQRICLDDGNFE